ncbi:MAG: sigma-70 family RNA polymerase sigma factor [Acidimicrobiales bacterium]
MSEGVEGVTVPSDFAGWYSRTHKPLVRALRAITSEDDAARDAADEAFARCLLHWRRVRVMGSPDGWAYRVALNELRRTLRRRALERRLLGRLPPPRPAPEPSVAAIDELLAGLPPRQRTAVVLRYVADLPEADVAAAMGVTRGTVASTLADARRALAASPHLEAIDV